MKINEWIESPDFPVEIEDLNCLLWFKNNKIMQFGKHDCRRYGTKINDFIKWSEVKRFMILKMEDVE